SPATRDIRAPCSAFFSTSSRPTCPAAAGRSRARRANAPPSSMSESSWASATTRSPSLAAPTSPASGYRTSSRNCFSAADSPPTSLSHVGMFASRQAYEQLLLRLAASPLPEARHFGELILAELQKVIPSFVTRVDRPDRGGDWIDYLSERRETTERWVTRLG